jgi:NDP-sugar pyrophosphorylase family protein
MKQFFNIVLPMAGKGSRFRKNGYKESKPFIDINGRYMIEHVIQNLGIQFDSNFKFIIICQKTDFEKYDFNFINKLIGHDNVEVITLDKTTEGAACTLLTAREFIDNKVPLLSFNSDQMIDYDANETFSRMSLHDGGMPCFYGESEDWSYAKTDKDGYVLEVAEKKKISDDATAGYYYWSRGSDFVKYADQMIAADDRINNEFYVAPVYNYAIKDGKKIVITHVDKVYELGTPDWLEAYATEHLRFANENDFDRGIFYETPENGLFEVKWPKGNLRYQWEYKDGIRADGISKSWRSDGSLKYKTYWRDGREYKRELIKKKRVAICFWGQTRTYSTLENYYSLHHDNIQFDYFISTWDDFKDKTPFDKCTEKEFIDPDITKFKNHTDRATYLIHRVNNLKSKYELDNGFVYDYILWTRSEILFQNDQLLNFIISKLDFSKYDGPKHTPFEVNTFSGLRVEPDPKDSNEVVDRIDADYSFFGTSLAFDLYSSIWKYYFKTYKCDNLIQKGFGGHHAHALAIKKFNLEHKLTGKIAHKVQFFKLQKKEV